MNNDMIPQWRRWDGEWTSDREYENPLQDVKLQVELRAPSGARWVIDGFWDGGVTWRGRFMPDEVGVWEFETVCSDRDNGGLHGQRGGVRCGAPLNETRFDEHGAVRVADNGRYLEHADGMPFFWLADTVWNGPMLSTREEWDTYLAARVAQTFTAAQWVTTQWIASPPGDRFGAGAFTGHERIAVNPEFFQRLDEKVEQLNNAGLVSAPVLLWAASWLPREEDNFINPGLTLPEAQAILLARYMVARWGGNHCVWILNGDGKYGGEKAVRWHHIGRGVFGGRKHAPVMLHPNGWSWLQSEFAGEDWLDIWGYQSSHQIDEAGWRWLASGPATTDWNKPPIHPIINLEPPYEYHMDMGSKGTRRISPEDVRRALYFSLLLSPTAGVTYGGHGVWGWDDGTKLPTAHELSGMPLPWHQALHMPAAEQLPVLTRAMESVEWWQLRPAQELVLVQPGAEDARETIAAAKSDAGDLLVVYIPAARQVELDLSAVQEGLTAQWFIPQTGEWSAAVPGGTREHTVFETPAEGDWLLVLD